MLDLGLVSEKNKKMKQALKVVIFGFFLFQVSQGFGQEKIETNQVIVRVFESIGSAPSEMVISYGEDKFEVVELENFKSKHREKNLGRLSIVIERLRNEGFSLISSTSTSVVAQGYGGYISLVSTYIFAKD